WSLPVADGQYTVRLHFVEPFSLVSGRRIDIELQGATVLAGFDPGAAAGGVNRAVVREFTVDVSAGAGMERALVNQGTNRGAVLSGIEILRINPDGVGNPTVALDLSTDGGASWTALAAGLEVDRFGYGSYVWTVGPETVGNTALIRARAEVDGEPTDTSDQGFLIANAGTAYYVNDGSLAGDEYTTAVGDNANSGKTPDAP